MRLKSIELFGFKSFVDRTVIDFDSGITGIVGPNGCGKSNIVDAIRWVMGDQSPKALRGNSMVDVIFNGTETRPPMGMASVVLTFDTSVGKVPPAYADYSEITIERRIYRSGEGEYFINKTPARLKDIIDLFLGTGLGARTYAIISQGVIEDLILAKPDDRRVFIEEAAGISKFKMRKEAAERKIETTKANLARLSDILAELERQKDSLGRQARKAERYKAYSDEIRSLEIAVLATQYGSLIEQVSELKQRLDQAKEIEEARKARLSTEEVRIEEERLKVASLEGTINEIQGKIYELQNEIKLIEAEISYDRRDASSLNLNISRWREELPAIMEKRERCKVELSEVNERKVEVDIQLLESEEALREKNAHIDGLRKEHNKIASELEEKRKELLKCVEESSFASSHLERLKSRVCEIEGWIAKGQAEIEVTDEKIRELEEKILSREAEIHKSKETKGELEKRRDELITTLNNLEAESRKIEERISLLKEALTEKRSRFHSLSEIQKNFEDYKEGVRTVLKKREEVEDFRGIIGTIGDVIETHPTYENALAASLGEKIQYVVVKSHEVGLQAIDYLKAEAVGRSTFVPIDMIRDDEPKAQNVSGEGILGPLVDYVTYPDDYAKIVNYLLKDIVLVDNMKTALKIWAEDGVDCTMVTLDGEVFDSSGVISGGMGADPSKRVLERRREMREIMLELEAMSTQIKNEEEKRQELKEKISSIRSEIEGLDTNIRHEELKLLDLEKDLNHLTSSLNYQQAERDKTTLGIAGMLEEKNNSVKEIEEASNRYKALSAEKAALEAGVKMCEEAEARIRSDLEAAIHEQSGLLLKIADLKRRKEWAEEELVRLLTEAAEGCSALAWRNGLISDALKGVDVISNRISRKEKRAEILVNTLKSLENKCSENQNKLNTHLSMLREMEAGLKNLRHGSEESTITAHEIELQYTQKKEKLIYISREAFDKYRLDLEKSWRDYFDPNLDLEAATKRVEEINDKIRRLGVASLDVIGEYEEVSKRYEFLKAQYEDLTSSLEALKKAVQKIDKTSKKRFAATFESVNERFKKLFPQLFGGGRAELILVKNEDELGDDGVDIIAEPPGKKLQSISLLSGGEKALAAIALIFALFLHNPSPFCLLDEVDAPLDDANIDRFNRLVKEMTPLSQFVIITHNKRTMELAETLYGVTMEEKGVSKVISVSLTREADEAA